MRRPIGKIWNTKLNVQGSELKTEYKEVYGWPEFVLVDQQEQALHLIICSTENGSSPGLGKTSHPQVLRHLKLFLSRKEKMVKCFSIYLGGKRDFSEARVSLNSSSSSLWSAEMTSTHCLTLAW